MERDAKTLWRVVWFPPDAPDKHVTGDEEKVLYVDIRDELRMLRRIRAQD